MNKVQIKLLTFWIPIKSWRRKVKHKIKTNLAAKKVRNFIESIFQNQSLKIITLYQYSFFDNDGVNYYSGGAEKYLCDLGKILKGMGYQPILIQTGNHLEKPWQRIKDDLIVVGIGSSYQEYTSLLDVLPQSDFSIYSGMIYFGNNLNKNSIQISHGITWDSPHLNQELKLINQIMNASDCLVSVDTNTISWLRTTFSKDVHKKNQKFKYIPNYVDLNTYKPLHKNATEKVKIIFPRRCCEPRGFYLIADILPQILTKYQNVEFAFIGFAHSQEIQDIIKNLIVSFPNQVSHALIDADKMHMVYQNADITLIPTLYSEGTSLSCLEAMACQNAVIATNIGGLPNLVIDGYNGLLINPDKEELHQAIELLIQNKELRDELSNNAVLVAQKFSKKQWEIQWKKILKNALKNQD